jgi:hypothetical protein
MLITVFSVYFHVISLRQSVVSGTYIAVVILLELFSMRTAHIKQCSAHHWIFSKVHTGPRFAHSFRPSVRIRLYNKTVQATSRSHTKS